MPLCIDRSGGDQLALKRERFDDHAGFATSTEPHLAGNRSIRSLRGGFSNGVCIASKQHTCQQPDKNNYETSELFERGLHGYPLECASRMTAAKTPSIIDWS